MIFLMISWEIGWSGQIFKDDVYVFPPLGFASWLSRTDFQGSDKFTFSSLFFHFLYPWAFLLSPSFLHFSLNLYGPVRSSNIKWIVSQFFDFQVFFMNHPSPGPWLSHKRLFECFNKFAKIVASHGTPPVSTTPASELTTLFTAGKFTGGCVVKAAYRCDNGGKLATSDTFAGGKFAPGVIDRWSLMKVLLDCLYFNIK